MRIFRKKENNYDRLQQSYVSVSWVLKQLKIARQRYVTSKERIAKSSFTKKAATKTSLYHLGMVIQILRSPSGYWESVNDNEEAQPMQSVQLNIFQRSKYQAEGKWTQIHKEYMVQEK